MKEYRVMYVKRLYVSHVEWIKAESEDDAWEKAEARVPELDSSYFDSSEADGDQVWVQDVQDEGDVDENN